MQGERIKTAALKEWTLSGSPLSRGVQKGSEGFREVKKGFIHSLGLTTSQSSATIEAHWASNVPILGGELTQGGVTAKKKTPPAPLFRGGLTQNALFFHFFLRIPNIFCNFAADLCAYAYFL